MCSTLRIATLSLLLALLPAGAASEAQSSYASSSQEEMDRAIVDWLRESAIPLRAIDPDDDFADLRALGELWKDTRIVGLGESTHGTSEYQRVRHRLIRYLVLELGFTAIALEAAYSDVQPINDYLLHGSGDLATALSGQGYLAWDTEEFTEMLRWLRGHNMTVAPERRVRLYGFDMHRNAVGRREVIDFLRQVAPELVAATDSIFGHLAAMEALWPRWDSATVASLRPEFEELQALFAQKEREMIALTSPAEYDRAFRFLQVMTWSVGPEPRGWMAEIAVRLIDEAPGTKFVFWAADSHIGAQASARRSLGSVLRQRYGEQYYAVGSDFGEGSYLARVVPASPPAGHLREVTVMPAAVRSLAWYVRRAGLRDFYIDLRSRPNDPLVNAWLAEPVVTRAAGWGYRAPGPHSAKLIGAMFDGMIFIESSSPTRPTRNGRSAAAKGELF